MHEFDIIKKYFSKLSKFNKHSLDLNDDVFFDKKKSLVISIDTYNRRIHFLNFKNLI
jgi:thiamine-monophosphate kinase